MQSMYLTQLQLQTHVVHGCVEKRLREARQKPHLRPHNGHASGDDDVWIASGTRYRGRAEDVQYGN